MQRRLRVTVTIPAAIGALLLATSACGGSASGSSEKGIDGKVVTIGFNAVLSGPQADYGNISRGARAYLKDVNSDGGINGYTFKFDVKDNGYQSSKAVAAARALAPDSFAIVTGGTPVVLGLKSVADSLKTPIFGAANGDYFASGSTYLFGQNPSYGDLALNDARFIIEELGIKKIAVLYENDDVGLGAAKKVPGYAASIGGEVLAKVAVPITATDFSTYAAKLKASGADAVVAMMAPNIQAGVQKAAIAINYNPKWTSIFATQAPAYIESVPASVAKNTYSDAYKLPVSAPPEGDKYKKVVSKYFPNALESGETAQGWNFGAVIATAVKDATDGGKPLTQKGFLNALETKFTGQRVGFIPSFTYDSSEHIGSSASAVYALTPSGVGKQVSGFKPFPKVQ